MIQPLPTDPPSRRRPLFILWLAVLVLAALVVGAVAIFLGQRERNAVAMGIQLAERAVAGAESGLNRTLAGIDLQLGHVARSTPAGGLSLRDVVATSVVVVAIDVFDARNRRLASSQAVDPAQHDAPPPELSAFVGRLLDDRNAPALAIGEPLVLLATSDHVVPVGRRFDGPGGPRVVVAQVPVALLTALMLPSETEGLVMTLEREDGSRLLAAPPQPPLAALPGPIAAATSGDPWQPGRGDALPAIVRARPLLATPLRIAVSLRRSSALAGFERQRAVAVGSASLLLLVLLAAGAVTHASVRRMLRARQMLHEALASMADGFLLCDAEDRVVVWNRRYLELFPWLAEVLTPGVPFRRLAEVAARQAARDGLSPEAWIEMRIDLHRSARHVWEQDLGNGTIVHALERPTPGGGTVSVYRDLTREELRLREARSAAEAANRAKSRFLATMSHEIRTPLNALIGVTDLLRARPRDAEDQRLLDLMQRSGRHLMAIVNDVLDLSQIESGRIVLEQQDFDPRQLLADVQAVMAPPARDRGLALESRVDPSIPCHVRGDPSRVRQVLFNLVGNAIKFTETGSVSIEASARPGEGGGTRLVVDIRDTGPGIAPADLPRLFERFTQIDDSIRRRHGGSGLGLAISRELARAMGGDITVDSELGRGTRFHVELPLAPALAPPAAARAEVPQSDGPGLSVLVAEDHDVNQLLIRGMLEVLGHRVEIAPDGAQALARVQSGRFDAVLMDVQMPTMDGLAATRAIRALPGPERRIPIVAMTANATTGDREMCLAAGMDDYLSKPLELNRLAEVLQRVGRAAAPAG